MDACAVNGFFSPAQIDKYSAAVPRAYRGLYLGQATPSIRTTP